MQANLFWAGIIGRIAGERLPIIALGGALVVLGVLVSELKIATTRKIEDSRIKRELNASFLLSIIFLHNHGW